jgi:hypothetical protein
MDAIDRYFARFPRFRYTPTTDWRQLGPFNALAKSQGWAKDKKKVEFQRLKQAWTKVVEHEFGDSSLGHYQSLCLDLDIDPIPEAITECKSELKAIFVNIVDLMQYRQNKRKGRKPQRFDDLEELKEYTDECGKYYPKETAKAEMLRELLKVLH